MIKKRGVQFPPVKEIENCAIANPDGFSMMWNEASGCVRTFKTMSRDKFIKAYKTMSAASDPRLTALVVHCRISTHGSNNVRNCHCWTTSDHQLGFAHNGVLSSIGSVKDMTDSETFFRFLFEPVFRDGGWSSAELLIKGVIGTSRFAFLLGTGEVKSWGSFVTSKESGCLYSNSSYVSWERKTPSYLGACDYTTGWGRGYRYYDDTYYDAD